VVAHLAHIRGSHLEQVAGLKNMLKMMTHPRQLRQWITIGRRDKVFHAKIVVVCEGVTKDDMEFAILDAFIQKRVSQRFTNIGRDVICRMGSEISVHTYAKVAVLQAYRVVVMLHERDVRLAQLNPGMFNVHDAYTLQALLALQCYLTGQAAVAGSGTDEVHVVAHLPMTSTYMPSLNWSQPNSSSLCVSLLDVNKKLNSMIMSCALQPGLGLAYHTMLSMHGADMKVVRVKDLLQYNQIDVADRQWCTLNGTLMNHIFIGIVRMADASNPCGRKEVILNPPDTTRVHFSDELLVLGDGSPVASSEEFQDEISASMESGKGSPPDWQRLKIWGINSAWLTLNLMSRDVG